MWGAIIVGSLLVDWCSGYWCFVGWRYPLPLVLIALHVGAEAVAVQASAAWEGRSRQELTNTQFVGVLLLHCHNCIDNVYFFLRSL